MLFDQTIDDCRVEYLQTVKSLFFSKGSDRDFYIKLSELIGDDSASFIETTKNTNDEAVTVEIVDDSFKVWVGKEVISIENSIHVAVWKAVLLHKIFKKDLGEDIKNLSGIFASIHGWSFIKISKVSEKWSTKLAALVEKSA